MPSETKVAQVDTFISDGLPFKISPLRNTPCQNTAPKPPLTAAIWRAHAHCGAPPA